MLMIVLTAQLFTAIHDSCARGRVEDDAELHAGAPNHDIRAVVALAAEV